MAYLGSGMGEIDKTLATINMACDTMTGNGSVNTMTLSSSQKVPSTVNNVSIYFDGVAQRPLTDYTLSSKTITFTTTPEAGVNVVCLSYASEYLDIISDATVYTDTIKDSAITDSKIAGMSASKLTGALPAIDGSAVTNFGVANPVIKSASDPTYTTNPAAVGRLFANTTSGEMFACTDATTGANVWRNIGEGQGDIAKPFGGLGGGVVSGYTSGGEPSASNIINKFAFDSGVTASDHGDISQARGGGAGSSSATQGFLASGYVGGYKNTIDKFNFAADATATDHGDMNSFISTQTGNSSSTHGFVCGGNGIAGLRIKQIDQFLFSANSLATDHGDLALIGYGQIGTSSKTDGYCAGGVVPALTTLIDKFSFASSGNSVALGDLSVAKSTGAGQSSTSHGYASGGFTTAAQNKIDSHAFNSDSTASHHGDLTVTRTAPAGQSSTTHGFTSGGKSPNVNVIDKFSFASAGDATDHGDLFSVISELVGHQV